jgi:hypothetical protein
VANDEPRSDDVLLDPPFAHLDGVALDSLRSNGACRARFTAQDPRPRPRCITGDKIRLDSELQPASPEPRSVMVPMSGLPIVNDAPALNSTRMAPGTDEFDQVEASAVRRPPPRMAPTVDTFTAN